jgi:hypothetical protein
MRPFGRLLIIAMLAGLTGVLFFGCSDNDISITPTLPQLTRPYPADNAMAVPVLVPLKWAYVDTASGPIFFDLCFGTTNPPPKIESHLTDTICHIEPLRTGTTYFWRVLAYSVGGDTAASAVWHFSTSQTFVMPLAIGNRWDYSSMSYDYNFQPESLVTILGDTVYESRTETITTMDTLSDSIETYVIRSYWNRGGDIGEDFMYRNNADDGYYTYAYRQPIQPPLKTLPSKYSLQFHGRRFGSLSDLYRFIATAAQSSAKQAFDTGIVFEDPPLRELAYPLSVGRQWTYRQKDVNRPFDMGKEVIEKQNLIVPAGQFECFKVRWYWDFDDDGHWDDDIDGYDYIAGIGLLKREFFMYGITVVDEFGEILGTFDSFDSRELTDYHLNVGFPAEP